ncbi:hypothetical protein PI124_g22860 [Phytophthora idaei]|nr:hypothetical protein PI126_g22767 [Phytophthora idaei]KAG3232052.1 hypothetical protein PI124_g22860 [Phytophthora idaei]
MLPSKNFMHGPMPSALRGIITRMCVGMLPERDPREVRKAVRALEAEARRAGWCGEVLSDEAGVAVSTYNAIGHDTEV